MSIDPKTTSLAAALAGLKEIPSIEKFLCICPFPSPNGPPELKLIFSRFREDSADLDSLAEWLALNAVNYVIPLSKRKRIQEEAQVSPGGGDMTGAVRLVKEAKRLFIEFNVKNPGRSAGEAGELLAYLVTLGVLGAAQLASKMALKTSANMPVHGLDGIHVALNDDVMTLYFLESKVYDDVQKGLYEYVKSAAAFGPNRKQYLLEYGIISDLGNLASLPDAEKALAMEYLDVYGPHKNKRLERSVGVVCFSEEMHSANKLPKSDTTPPQKHEEKYSETLSKDHGTYLAYANKRMAEDGLDPATCKLFLVAVPSVATLNEKFREAMS